MSKYSSIINGKVCDWRWERQPHLKRTLFYIGDIRVGQLFYHGRRNGWAVVHRLPSPTGFLIKGFISRLAASEFLSEIEQTYREKQNEK